MHEIQFTNGRPSNSVKPRLDCTVCKELQRFARESDEVVRCRECDTRHNNDSVVDANAIHV